MKILLMLSAIVLAGCTSTPAPAATPGDPLVYHPTKPITYPLPYYR